MTHNHCSVDIYTLTTEERSKLFLLLFEADPSLLNAFTPEQRRRLYAVLTAIDPSIGPFPDARSAIVGVANEQVGTYTFHEHSLRVMRYFDNMILLQFPKGSTMNPIRRREYENYKEAQKKLNKEPQWNEFLKLDKKQYLNFRVSKQMLIIILHVHMSYNLTCHQILE